MENTNYVESRTATAPQRKAYLQGIRNLVDTLREEKRALRDERITRILEEPDVCRREYAAMLGWPLTIRRKTALMKEQTYLGKLDGVCIYRTTWEVLPGIPFTGLLFLRDTSTPRPLVISQHGGLGTPEICSTLNKIGSTNYNEQTRRLLKYDVNVFAPQLLLWSCPDEESDLANVENERMLLDAQLKSAGSSITAIELYALQACLDWLCEQPYVDAEQLGMLGLSYGGMYTMLLTALDTRIRSAVSAAFFSGLEYKPHTDWLWQNGWELYQDAELAALCWPRRICFEMGRSDELFDWHKTQEIYDRLCRVAKDIPIKEKITLHLFEGTHETSWDDKPIEIMMRDLGAAKVSE